MLIDLQGQIERITYTNPENGYTVAKLKVYGQDDLITIVGSLFSPSPGEILKIKGEWAEHSKYGSQFKIVEYTTTVPATVYGIKKYLGSGLIKGIGPVMAERIVKQFGKDTLDIIETDPHKLSEIGGIGSKRIKMIEDAWIAQKEIRNVMIFLQAHGVSSGYATKIFKQYDSRSIQVVKENPYRLAMDIYGIGFVTADKIAEKLGFLKDAPVRVQAGIIYVLHQVADDGNVYYPYQELIKKSEEILQVQSDPVIEAISEMTKEQKIVMEDLNESLDTFIANNKAVYLTKYYVCETGIARKMKSIIQEGRAIKSVNPDESVSWVQSKLSIVLAEKQKQAIQTAIQNKIVVITGGPGTGKTTIINAILKIFSQLTPNILLAAPTGRAAKRMSETTGYESKTIHRMLEFNMQNGGFQKNDEKPLKCDILIIDEASMIDTVLMYHLLKAVPLHAVLIFVGDVNQLPSVGAGNVLNDIILSGTIPVVTLTEIFRQAKESSIIVNAHRINNGFFPVFDLDGTKKDFFFMNHDDPEKVLEFIIEIVKERIPKRFGLDPIEDIQVLTPMNKGIVGTNNLNLQLQEILNPSNNGEEVLRRGRTFRINDKVMQIKNNYDKMIFNGDIGRIINIDKEQQEVIIDFDKKEVFFDFSDLDEIVLAYAVSVHKSQGSEYPAVVIPIVTQHYMLLQRNLIYTAVTRGKKLVVMIGSNKALAIAVKNDKTERRYTYLSQRLK
ncbi:MAG: ATP-dependent RecD-like DNA helicase [Desulfobacterales bacterium]|nr:ATP-dependent RecD-like DNA helicase [Desulfobacterales bacterium]